MNLKEQMDPELWAVYSQLPVLPDPVTDILGARRQMLEMIAGAYGDRAPDPRVSREDREINGPAGKLSLPVRIYRPAGQPRPLPALLWIHGGGFTLGHPDQDDPLCERIVTETNCVVVSVDYRLAPEHPFPAATDDCHAGLQWLYQNANDLQVVAERIAVGGASAGGGIAAGVALMARDRSEIPLCYQLLLCGCLDDRHVTLSAHEITDERSWSRSKSLSGWSAYLGRTVPDPATNVSHYAAPARATELAGSAPAFLMVGELDLMRDETVNYASRLLQAGVSTELHVWPGAFHGFEVLAPEASLSRAAVTSYLTALKRALSA